MKKIALYVSVMFLTACNTTPIENIINPPIKLDNQPLTSEIEKNGNTLFKKISYKNGKGNLFIKAECDGRKDTGSIRVRLFSKGSLNWSFQKFDEKGDVKKFYDIKDFSGLSSYPRDEDVESSTITTFQEVLRDHELVLGRGDKQGIIERPVAKYFTPIKHIDQFINSCIELSIKDTKEIEKKKLAQEKYKKDLENLKKEVSEKLNATPMYNDENVSSFVAIDSDLRSYGEKAFKNNFVWISDNYYTVRKTLKIKDLNAIVLDFNPTNYYIDPMPVIVLSTKSAILGQTWSQISNAPLVFMGVISGENARKDGLRLYSEQYIFFADTTE